jgi:hypothetical protein
MHRPEDLPQAVQVDYIPDFHPQVIGREAAVVVRMPILRRDHQGELPNQPIGHGNNGISIRHGQGPARTKVVLDIHQNQCTLWHGPDLCGEPPLLYLIYGVLRYRRAKAFHR